MTLVAVAIIALLIVLNGLLALSEMAIVAARRTRLEALSESVAELRTGMAPAPRLGSQREPVSSGSSVPR